MNKLLFIHTPKTAGQYVTSYMRQTLKYQFILPNQPLNKTRKTIWYDFDAEELRTIAETASMTYIDTHFFTPFPGGNNQPNKIDWATSDQEITDLLQLFKNNGWFTFSFVRDPKEQLCSLYFFGRDNYKSTNFTWLLAAESLDDFIKRYKGEAPIPKFWDQLDYVDEFSDTNFNEFLTLFGHRHIKLKHKNASSNRGFKFYYELGMISQEAVELIEASTTNKIFNDIKSAKSAIKK